MLEEKVEKTITKYHLIEKNDSIVIGVSGGPDSMTLLFILLKLKEKYNLKIYVAHINHMIRENAQKDEQYVKEFCNRNNIQLFIKREDVILKSKKEKKGLEEAGREVRYDFFEEVLKETKSNKIAIAHNLNDKAETIIMNAIRGSGLSGLRGIEPKRGKYIRPLIEIDRKEIEKYCEDNKINPRHDESNDDNNYTRNKIRNIAIPYIQKELNSNIINNLNRLSEIVKENEEYIEKETNKAFQEILICQKENKIEYNIQKFNQKEKIIQKKLVLKGIEKTLGNCQGIEKINIEDIIKLFNNNIGNKFLMPNKKIKIGIKNKKIYFEKVI
ncbi:MAG: tRNA lysidine(34) synthetase TilS [Clostridia bacterium]